MAAMKPPRSGAARALTVAVLLVLAGAVALAATASSTPEKGAVSEAKGGPAAPAAVAPAAPAPAAPRKVEDPKAIYRVPVDGSPERGAADALVTLVWFSDVECAFCKQVAPAVDRLEEAHRGRLRVVWKHVPSGKHPSATPGALVSEAARASGGDAAFWAVTRALLAADPMGPEAVERAAALAGVDLEKVLADQPRRLALIDRIRADQNLAFALDARATPTFFFNGRKVVGAQPFEALEAAAKEALARAEAEVRAGVAPRDVYARLTEKGASAPVLVAAPAPAAAPARSPVLVTVRADEALKGPRLAPVTIAVFSDFQCPFCSRVEPTLSQLEQAYPGKVRFAWKHQPLPFHPQALPAARAAEAARLQGKFWEMHDRLFAGQAGLGEAAYLAHAKALGLDLARFQRDAASEAVAARIAEDQKLAQALGATGTPTAFVNCRRVVGAQPYDTFKALVEEELKKAKARIAAGEPLDEQFSDRACAANAAAEPPPAAAAVPRTGVKVAVRGDDPARGPAAAPVTVVEFSEFQCPFCARAVGPVKELEQVFGQSVRVVWKHLPLPFHKEAMPAALAAEAARSQGKFWEMHDRLFAGQQALSTQAYAQHARELGLDLARFQATMASPEAKRRVGEDLEAARAAGVSGTPTFVVNGDVVVGASGLRAAVERKLEAARSAAR